MGDDHFLNLQPGTIVNGRYEVVKCLGAGSMGMVYACRHRELAGRLVAMKVLFAEVAVDAVATARFRNEIFASYEVNHPNVVRAYEYFRDGDLIAFTMEYVGGGDLADRISSENPIPIEDIVRMLSQMCSGVQAIHDAGIIHRDLKPENILLTAQDDIKITDFGIARTGSGPKLTEYGGVVGTIDYVSPEYLEVGQVDARSDIYALGVLGFEMITGESPFKGQSVFETITMRLRSDPPFPAELRPECSKDLSDIVLKALRRDPELRYQTAQAMFDDLKTMTRGRSGGLFSNPYVSDSAERKEARSSAADASYDDADLEDVQEESFSSPGVKDSWISGWDDVAPKLTPPQFTKDATAAKSGWSAVVASPERMQSEAAVSEYPSTPQSDAGKLGTHSQISQSRLMELQQKFGARGPSIFRIISYLFIFLFLAVLGLGLAFFIITSSFDYTQGAPSGYRDTEASF